jgi:transposase
MPERYGRWNTVWQRLACWRDLGAFDAAFAVLAGSGAEKRLQMITTGSFTPISTLPAQKRHERRALRRSRSSLHRADAREPHL